MGLNGRVSIRQLRAIQVLDSRARPTVSVEVVLSNDMRARASAPSGASTGSAEALELRDNDLHDFAGTSVRLAVRNVTTLLSPALAGLDITQQSHIDRVMNEVDATSNWSRIGGNASVATSMAVCRAAAMSMRMPLHRYIADLAGAQCSMPMPMTNILSGGLHARQGMDIQDFLVVPNGAASYAQALDWICRVRAAATEVVSRHGASTLLADEGGLSPSCSSIADAFDLMMETFDEAKLRPGDDVSVAIDMATTGLFDGVGAYCFAREGKTRTAREIASMLADFAHRYPLLSIEDPCAENDWSGWAALTRALPEVQIIGDDLFATQPDRILRGKELGAGNAVLIKINQNGSLTGTLQAVATARQVGFRTIVSARSGETEDDFIADLAVGTDAGQIKIGSVRSSERQAKYNKLAWIAADEGERLRLCNPWATLPKDRERAAAKVR